LSQTTLKKILSIARQPFVLFWLYYAIGPIVALDKVYDISYEQSLFVQEEILPNIIRHIVGFMLLSPLVLYCATLDLSHSNRTFQFNPKFAILLPALFIFAILLFMVISATDLSIHALMPDKLRAEFYRDWIHEFRIIPLLILGLTLGVLFFGPITFLILGVPAIAIDLIMGRRHILLLFIYPAVNRLGTKGAILLVTTIGVLTSMRHGFDHIATNAKEVLDAIFSESYMIFLSSTTHSQCAIDLEFGNGIFHFERLTEFCRVMDYSAGGFSARFQYDVIFGVISVAVYSFLFWLILKLFHRSILPVFREILGIVIFTALFITYRDDMGNSLIFLLQYVLVLSAASVLLKSLRTNKANKANNRK
jgi:hypothetical protein